MKKEAIILKNLDYKESSKLVYVYSSEGKDSFQVKGAKRIKSTYKSLIEPLTQVNYEATNANFKTLRNMDLINNFDNLKYNLEKQIYSLHLLEIIYRLGEEINHDKVYKMLKKALGLMNNGFDIETISFAFELKFLFFLGFGIKNLKYNFNTTMTDIISKLYYSKFEELEDFSIKQNQKSQVRKFIDLQYEDNLTFRTNTRKFIFDIYNY